MCIQTCDSLYAFVVVTVLELFERFRSVDFEVGLLFLGVATLAIDPITTVLAKVAPAVLLLLHSLPIFFLFLGAGIDPGEAVIVLGFVLAVILLRSVLLEIGWEWPARTRIHLLSLACTVDYLPHSSEF